MRKTLEMWAKMSAEGAPDYGVHAAAAAGPPSHDGADADVSVAAQQAKHEPPDHPKILLAGRFPPTCAGAVLSYDTAAALLRQDRERYRAFAVIARAPAREEWIEAETSLVLFGFSGLFVDLAGLNAAAGARVALITAQRAADLCERHGKTLWLAPHRDERGPPSAPVSARQSVFDPPHRV